MGFLASLGMTGLDLCKSERYKFPRKLGMTGLWRGNIAGRAGLHHQPITIVVARPVLPPLHARAFVIPSEARNPLASYKLQITIENRQSKIANRKSPIGNRQSAIGNRQSPIENRQSKIANRQSAIENRKSERPN